MSKLWLILKMQVRSSMNAAAMARSSKRSSWARKGKLGQVEAPVKKGGAKVGGYIALMAFVWGIMFVFVFGFCTIMAQGLPVEHMSVIPAIFMATASIMCLITTIYKVNGSLFGFRDYDMMMSLPIPAGTVITSRMVILYSLNILFTSIAVIPSLIAYQLYAPVTPAFWPMAIVALLFIPLVPIVVATVIGSLIAVAASHFKRKTGASMIITVAALLAWLLFCMNMNTIATNFAAISTDVVNVLNKIYPLTDMYTKAVCDQNILSFVLFLGISVGVFAAFVAIVGKNYKKLNAIVTANRTTSDYKMQALVQSSPKKALFQKEWKRFTSSSLYMMNTGIGAIMLIALSVVLLILGGSQLESLVQMPGLMEILGRAAPFVISLFVAMTCTSSCSISLEGKQLWIMKSIPVHTKDILWSKLRVNLQLLVVTIVISATMFAIALKTGPVETLMMYVTPLAYAGFTATLGLKLNLNLPNFDWDSEIRVIKQSMPVMIVLFVGMGMTIAPMILSLSFGGNLLLYIITAALIVIDILLYRNIMTKGVRQFDAMDG